MWWLYVVLRHRLQRKWNRRMWFRLWFWRNKISIEVKRSIIVTIDIRDAKEGDDNLRNGELYEVIKVDDNFQIKTHNIVFRNKSLIRTNSLFSTPKAFETNKLNKFVTSKTAVLSSDTNKKCFGFTLNRDLADCFCLKYNLLQELQAIDNKLDNLFEEENYLNRQKQKLLNDYHKTQQTILYQMDMMDIRKSNSKYNT